MGWYSGSVYCLSINSLLPNSSPSSEVDAPAESDGFGVYIKLERDDISSIALHGGSFTKVCENADGSLLKTGEWIFTGDDIVQLSTEENSSVLFTVSAHDADNVQYFAKVDGEIIGTASLNRRSNRMSHRGVFGISLKKAWWGCGAASALMEAILAFAKENGFEQLNLEVCSSNTRAIHLYEKYGFRKLCTFPHFFKINGEYIDFDLMNLELNEAGEQT